MVVATFGVRQPSPAGEEATRSRPELPQGVRTSIRPTNCRESVAIPGRAGAALQQERHDRHLERCAHEPARHFLLRRVADALEDEFLIRVFTEAHLRQLGGIGHGLGLVEIDEPKRAERFRELIRVALRTRGGDDEEVRLTRGRLPGGPTLPG